MAIPVTAYCTHRVPPEIHFPHEASVSRDRSDPATLSHLDDVINYIMQGGEREMTASLYGVFRHLQRVQVQFQFTVEGEDVEAIAPWAWQSNAILLLPDGAFRDPNGAVLVDPDTGLPDDHAQIPFLPSARQRKAQTELLLRNRLIDLPDALPPVVSEEEVVFRSPDDIAWRAISLFITAVRAESVASGKPIAPERLKEKSPLAFKAFTAAENEFVHEPNPDPQTVIQFAWRYEALYVLQWALGLHDSLPFPDEICDVPLVAQTMMNQPERELIAQAGLRSPIEILDALDQNYRLLWAAREAMQQKTDPPAQIDGSVISERQHALNWLTCFEDAPWDEVDIPS